MQIIVLLIAISLSIAVIFLGIFFWNIKSGQYEDTVTPSIRMLFDNPVGPKEKTIKSDKPNEPPIEINTQVQQKKGLSQKP